MTDWIEIFRGGIQVDSQGRYHDGDAMIDQAVSSFDAERHEPPLVVGHPADNAPAFGWVEGLRRTVRDGVASLEARFKQVAPELVEAVQRGLYKKRSASFYPDGALRHVGLLGAAPPAVKGLAPLKFVDGDAILFTSDMSDRSYQSDRPDITNQRSIVMEIKEFFETLKSWIGLAKDLPGGMGGPPVIPDKPPAIYFTEADAQALAAKAAAEARAAAESEFAEAARKKAAQEAQAAHGKAISERLDQLIKDGKIPPAIADKKLEAFLLAIDAAPEIAFADGKPQPPSEFMFGFLDQLEKMNLFSEIAKKTDASTRQGEDDWALGKAIASKSSLAPKQ